MNNTRPTISLAEMECIIEVLEVTVDRLIEDATALASTDRLEAIYTTGIARGLNAASNALYKMFFTARDTEDAV